MQNNTIPLMSDIIYFQTNEEIAGELKKHILRDDIRVLHAKEKEEALRLVKENEVLLLLIDVDILKEELEEFLGKVRVHSRKIEILVCLGEADVLFIEKLINTYDVRKVYISPINPDVVTEDMETIVGNMEKSEPEPEEDISFEKEQEEIMAAFGSLTARLKKQQHSYKKMLEFTSCFEDAFLKMTDSESTRKRLNFAKEIYTSLIRMQTTGVFDIEKFTEDVTKDLKMIGNGTCKVVVNEVNSCLFGGLSKPFVQNIRFCIYLITRLYSEYFNEIALSVNSKFLTTINAEFKIEISHDMLNDNVKEAFNEYEKMVLGILEGMADDVRKQEETEKTTYYCNFPVSNE